VKVEALISRLTNGEVHVLVDTLRPGRVRDALVVQERAFPETAPVVVDIEIPAEELHREERAKRDTEPCPMAFDEGAV